MLLAVKTVKMLSNKEEVSIFHIICVKEMKISLSFICFSSFVISYGRCYIWTKVSIMCRTNET